MAKSKLKKKLTKLVKHPRMFVEDAVAKRFGGGGRHPMFLVERIWVKQHYLFVAGRGVSGFMKFVRTFSGCEAILRNKNNEFRLPMRDVARVDLKKTGNSKQPGRGFRFDFDVREIPPGRYEVSFHIPQYPESKYCFRNIRTYRLQRTYRTASTMVTARIANQRIGAAASRNCRLVLTFHKDSILPYTPMELLIAAIRSLFLNRYEFTKILHLVTRRAFAGRRIFLLGERGDTAQDNGYHLFKYIRKNHPDVEAYYILEGESPDWEKMSAFGNIIAKDSMRHWVLLLHAECLVNAYDIDSYMLPSFFNKQTFLRKLQRVVRYRRVFLQHGIIHNDVAKTMHYNNTGYDIMICSAPPEHKYLNVECQYDGWAKLTGLPRFDALQDESGEEQFILLMPTWRRWLVQPSYRQSQKQDNDKFVKSDYYKFYNELLNHSSIVQILTDAGLKIKFYLHYEMQPFAQLFESNPQVDILQKGEADVQQLLKSARMLMTDYSSVFFDFAYMEKPIIHCAFDEDKFFGAQYRRSYFDIRTTGFGPVCSNVSEVVEALERSVGAGFRVDKVYAERVEKFFRGVKGGGSCCERVYEEVIAVR